MDAFEWPLRPDGTEVPRHRRSLASMVEGYPIFCASDWRKVGGISFWMCGFCEKTSSDPLSAKGSRILADCEHCGKTNRISM